VHADQGEPEDWFGPFNELTPEAQRSLIKAADEDEHWRLKGYDLGNWQMRIARVLKKPTLRRLIGEISSVAHLSVRAGPARLLYEAYLLRLKLGGLLSRRPSVASALALARFETRRLSVCYATGLSQSFSYRGFWNDRRRHLTIGSILGIDLIPAPNGCWFVESNLDAALRAERTALYGRDPFVLNLLSFASSQGFRRLVLIVPRACRLDALMTRQLSEGATALGIALTIIEDADFPESPHTRSHGIPGDAAGKDTLVARMKYFRTNLDYVFQHKTASHQALRLYQRQCGDRRFQLPETELTELCDRFRADEPYPNIVYKFPERDRGRGLFFLKVGTPEEARALVRSQNREAASRDLVGRLYEALDDHHGMFEGYVRGKTLGDRLYIVRAHVLVTPVGVTFLSAHRVIAGSGVPTELPPGIVRDVHPFLVNYSAGATYAVVPPDEEALVADSAISIGQGFAWAAARGFGTEDDAPSEDGDQPLAEA
jgi:hypothetical protein